MERLYELMIEEHFDENRQMLFLMGPRQVGKTTIARAFKRKSHRFYYFNWDNLDDRELIAGGPRAVASKIGLERPSKPPVVVFDEIHKYKNWKLFIKGFFDSYAHNGEVKIIVTGSARLEMFNTGGESLMGRYFRFRIHPLTVAELLHKEPSDTDIRPPKQLSLKLWDALYAYGGFPEPYLKRNENFSSQWQQLRSQQFFQDEIREVTRIHEIAQMELLSRQVALQAGSLVSYSSFAKKTRISVDTARRWIQALTALYFCFPLTPWSKNVSRSLIKEPKLYLWDWSSIQDLGAKAENFIACHLLKAVHFWTDCGIGAYDLHFIRDKEKREVDFLVSRDGKPWFLVEVKHSGHDSLSKSLCYFHKKLGTEHAFQVVIDAPYERVDCFEYDRPIIVPAQTLLSQLV